MNGLKLKSTQNTAAKSSKKQSITLIPIIIDIFEYKKLIYEGPSALIEVFEPN